MQVKLITDTGFLKEHTAVPAIIHDGLSKPGVKSQCPRLINSSLGASASYVEGQKLLSGCFFWLCAIVWIGNQGF